MEIWDFNEDKNYTNVNNYKVLNFPDKVKAAELLEEIRIMIMNLFIQLQLEEKGSKYINLLRVYGSSLSYWETRYLIGEVKYLIREVGIRFNLLEVKI